MSAYPTKAEAWNAPDSGLRRGLSAVPEHHISWMGTVDDTVINAIKCMSDMDRIPSQIKVHGESNENEILLGGFWHKNALPVLVWGTLNMSKGVPKWLVRFEQTAPRKYVDETDKQRYHCQFDFTDENTEEAKYLHMHDIFIRSVCAVAIRPLGEEYEDATKWANIFGVLLNPTNDLSIHGSIGFNDPASHIEVFETHTAYCEDWFTTDFRGTSDHSMHKAMNKYHWRGTVSSPSTQPLFYRQRYASDLDAAVTGDTDYTMPKEILDKWWKNAMSQDIRTTTDAKVQTHRYIALKDDKRKPIPVSITRGKVTPVTTGEGPTYWVDQVACTDCGQRLIMYLSKAQSPESGSRPDLTVTCPDCLADFNPYPLGYL